MWAVSSCIIVSSVFEARAKENQVLGGEVKVPQNSAEARREKETREKLAKLANVSHDTINRCNFIDERADEDTKSPEQRD